MAPGGSTTRTSSVWGSFIHRDVRGDDIDDTGASGSGATATCRSCGTTLRASSRKHGTSQLWRHVRSRSCAARAAGRHGRQPPTPPPPPAAAGGSHHDDDDEEGFHERLEALLVKLKALEGLLNIEGGDELVATADGGEVVVAGDDRDQRRSPNYVRLPQVSSPSSGRFFQKKRQRIAHLASQQIGTSDNSPRNDDDGTSSERMALEQIRRSLLSDDDEVEDAADEERLMNTVNSLSACLLGQDSGPSSQSSQGNDTDQVGS